MSSPDENLAQFSGPEQLAAAIADYTRMVAAVDLSKIALQSGAEGITLVQDAVWSAYCEEHMGKRQQIFDVIQPRLQETAPFALGFTGSSLLCRWSFGAVQDTKNSKVELITTVDTQTRWRHLPERLTYNDEYHLLEPECNVRPAVSDGVPVRVLKDDGTLGRSVLLSSDYFHGIHQAAVENIYKLGASVSAKVLGSTLTKPTEMAKAAILTSWHDRLEGRPTYLQHENAQYLVGPDGNAPSMNNLLSILNNNAAEHAQAYEIMSAIAGVLRSSSAA